MCVCVCVCVFYILIFWFWGRYIRMRSSNKENRIVCDEQNM